MLWKHDQRAGPTRLLNSTPTNLDAAGPSGCEHSLWMRSKSIDQFEKPIDRVAGHSRGPPQMQMSYGTSTCAAHMMARYGQLKL